MATIICSAILFLIVSNIYIFTRRERTEDLPEITNASSIKQKMYFTQTLRNITQCFVQGLSTLNFYTSRNALNKIRKFVQSEIMECIVKLAEIVDLCSLCLCPAVQQEFPNNESFGNKPTLIQTISELASVNVEYVIESSYPFPGFPNKALIQSNTNANSLTTYSILLNQYS